MAATAAAPMRNPKDSMKSTWRTDKSQWNITHWLFDTLNMWHRDLDKPIPVHQKTDPVPWVNELSSHRWILTHAAWPMVLHQLYIWTTGKNLNPIAAFVLYAAAMQINSILLIHIIRRLSHIYGFFDGDKAPRDEIPDHGVVKTFNSLELTVNVRPMIAVIFAYQRDQGPTLSWWLPIELGFYSIILDGWFYLYHRSCHELESLWKFHRTHHLTKHPNPLLSSYADIEQEFIELALVPFLSWMTLKTLGFPMGFYDWWVCHEYIIFTEPFGHSGLRAYASTAGAFNWILMQIGAELTIEDHDLHHRKGWKNSHNYGKQTRLWDKIFGTCYERIEAPKSNVDWNQRIDIPLF